MTSSPHTARPEAWQPTAADIEAIAAGRHGDPFARAWSACGAGRTHLAARVRSRCRCRRGDRRGRRCRPRAARSGCMTRASSQRFSQPAAGRSDYRLRLSKGGHTWVAHDTYRFPPCLGEMDVYLIGEGTHRRLYERFGAHPATIEGVDGVTFAVWAPNARRVSVVGQFNAWDGRRHPMRRRIEAGLWELFIPASRPGRSLQVRDRRARRATCCR